MGHGKVWCIVIDVQYLLVHSLILYQQGEFKIDDFGKKTFTMSVMWSYIT